MEQLESGIQSLSGLRAGPVLIPERKLKFLQVSMLVVAAWEIGMPYVL